MGDVDLILVAGGAILLSVLWKYMLTLIWKPYVITKNLRKQGVMGPESKFIYGNTKDINRLIKDARDVAELDIYSHDHFSRIFPHFVKWTKQYGKMFLYWDGTTPGLCITNAELVKQVLSNKFGSFPKRKPTPQEKAIFGGQGLVLAQGSQWATHRRIITPAFTMDKLKVMTKQMAECVQSMLDNWHDKMVRFDAQNNSIQVGEHFKELTADIISHAAFGSSYGEGLEVFLTLKELVIHYLATSATPVVPIPGISYFPTKSNRHRLKLQRKLKNKLMSIITNRLDSKTSDYGNDLLGLLLETNRKEEGRGMNIDEIIDECKTFFFAGHETTAILLTWTMFMLSTNLDWQEKLRQEVVEECGMEIPNADNLSKLKLVTMYLLETLRLYPPIPLMKREAAKNVSLGEYKIPEGIMILIPIALIHMDEELWGETANEFNPLRFENGITGASKLPSAMLGFSIGPRSCVAQNFGMLEAKLAIAMILQRFKFSLSNKYKHMPARMITLQPQYGLPIVLKPLVNEICV